MSPTGPHPIDLAQDVFVSDAWAASQVHPVAADLASWKRERWLEVRHLPIEQQGPDSLRVLRDYLADKGVEIRPRALAYLVRTLSEMWATGESEWWEPREAHEHITNHAALRLLAEPS